MPRFSRRLSKPATLLLSGVLAGLAVAAVVLPLAVPAGLLAKTGAASFADLPAVLRTPPTPQSSFAYASDGKTLLTTFYDQNRHDVTLAEIPQVMRDAIVSSEDGRFYDHGGVDPRGVLRALVSNSDAGQVTQGASTLTMQYVRNVLLYTAENDEQQKAATEVSAGRKLREIRYAAAIEQRLSKDEILRRYLNIAYFGHGAYGIYAAAQTYFSTAPADLTLAQAALLAGLVQAPDSYDPTRKDLTATLARRAYVLDRMAALHHITAAQATAAKKQKIALKLGAQPSDCVDAAKSNYGFFCAYLRQWWDAQPAFGATVAEREAKLLRGGYSIVTSLDPALQAAAQKHVNAQIEKTNRYAMSVAVVQPGTGRVQAMAVNRTYSPDLSDNLPNTAGPGKGSYPNTVNPLISGGKSVTGYQAGSTFKMFTMLAALSDGMPLDTQFDAPARIYTSYPGGGKADCGGYWCPSNANPSWMDGRRAMWDGFGRSVNTYFVWLEQQVGVSKAIAMAQKLGITVSRATGEPADASMWGSFTLGTASTTPLALANAYATVAAEGQYCAPTPIASIHDAAGHRVSTGQPSCSQVISADVARAATDAARCPVGDQSADQKCNGGTATMVADIVGRPVAGKTGTTDETKTATFAGFTPQLAAAGIVANPDNPNDPVGDLYATKVDLAIAYTLKDGSKDLPDEDFGKPSEKIAYGEKADVPSVSCHDVSDAMRELSDAGFRPVQADEPVPSGCPAGSAAWTSPSGRAALDAPVTVYVSSGQSQRRSSPPDSGAPSTPPSPPGR